MTMRHLLIAAALLATPPAVLADAPKPNVIVIFADDLGYGDLGCFGHPTIRTPNIDAMAAQGQRWTQFYVAASVCTPSRAGLLTGRYPIRSGMCTDGRRVLFPDSTGGLPASELTIPECLKRAGYATAMIGKWHLGHLPQFLPTQHGFDTYLGIPYSHDMDPIPDGAEIKSQNWRQNPTGEGWRRYNVPLIQDGQIVERPVDSRTITRRYTEHAIEYIRQHKDGPFFLYLAHSMPHTPLFTNEQFAGTSRRGLYGDVVEEIDWSTGQILQTLRELKIDRNTLVVFTSDNGPWKIFNQFGGSAGLLRGGKAATFEGGMREPTIFWWPGTIQPAVINDLGSTLDVLPTLCALAGVGAPTDRVLDGYDLTPTLLHGEPSPRDSMIYYCGQQVWAARKGAFKIHFTTFEPANGRGAKPQPQNPPLLYNLDVDPSEEYDVAANHPVIIRALIEMVEAHRKTVEPVPNQLDMR